jgi:hypothetical protein
MGVMCAVSALVGASDEPQITAGSESPTVETRVLALTPKGATDEASVDLRTAYLLLRQVDPKKLDERPKELTERALTLYRDALKAYEQGNATEAGRLGAASRELAHALELARFARSEGIDQSELPPPPPLRFSVQADLLTEAHEGPVPTVVELPPVLNGVVLEVDGKPGDSVEDHSVQAEVKIVGSEGDSSPVEINTSEEVKVLGDDSKRRFVIASPKQAIREKIFVRRAGPGGVITVPGRAQLQSVPARANRTFVVWQDEAAQARTELQTAYDLIRQARREKMKDETKLYLDAARDLYNAARREAGEGRHSRAIELAQAAVAVVRVPDLLAGKEEAAEREARTFRGRQVRIERGQAKTEAKGRRSPARIELEVRGQAEEKKGDGAEGEPKFRVEIRKRIVDKDGKVSETVEVKEGDDAKKLLEGGPIEARIKAEAGEGEDKADAVAEKIEDVVVARDQAGPVVGIGIALEQVDDAFVVRELVPDGPAAKEGSIRAGDVLIGVEVDGKTEEFEGKPLVDVVKRIRGEEDSAVRVVIQPKGEGERKTIELKRVRIPLPATDEAKENEAKPGPEVFLFEAPRGGRTIRMAPRQTIRRGAPVPGAPLRFRFTPKSPEESNESPKDKSEKNADLPPSIDV